MMSGRTHLPALPRPYLRQQAIQAGPRGLGERLQLGAEPGGDLVEPGVARQIGDAQPVQRAGWLLGTVELRILSGVERLVQRLYVRNVGV